MTPIEEIKEQFDKVIIYSQAGITEPQTDRLFDLWLEGKRDIIEAFGGQYIYEIPEKVCFEIPESAKSERINGFINYLWEFGYSELGRFLDYQRDGFFKNQVIEEYSVCDEKNIIITKGTKLVKAFKYFIKDEVRLHEIQDKASLILQENKIEGYLCFSVHPLDYLSVSENTYNWRSCHALDGEYRAGNLSYMMDKSTIVCYLRGEKEAKLPNFPDDVLWNSKKWRVLLYLSNDWKMIFAGKQYPFSTDSGMKKIIECFNQKRTYHPSMDLWSMPGKNSVWNHWEDFMFDNHKLPSPEKDIEIEYEFYTPYVPVGNELIRLSDLVKDGKGSKQFNDVLRSSCYKPVYTHLINKSWGSYYTTTGHETRFEIGAMTYCLRCGKEEVVDSCSTMMCYDCEFKYGVSENDNFGFCECCGTRLEIDTAYYVDDETYCTNCYNNHAAHCAECGGSYLISEMHYDENKEEYYCSWCHNEEDDD